MKHHGTSSARLRIVHIVRDPLGGVMRNIRDLAMAQIEAGHEVGIICGSSPELIPFEEDLALGCHIVPMARNPRPSDLKSLRGVARELRHLEPDVVHGHGAKGGLYARLVFPQASIYSPHGGVLHYSGTLALPLLWVERQLLRRTGGVVFVAQSEMTAFQDKIGKEPPFYEVIHNGLASGDFEELDPAGVHYDLAYIGQIRTLKGVGDLLGAIRILDKKHIRPRVLIAGPSTPADAMRYGSYISQHQLHHVEFVPRTVATRDHLSRTHVAIMPSRSEGLPYFALEVSAVGVPLIATRAGGIPEVFGPTAGDLVTPGDEYALADVIQRTLSDLEAARARAAMRRDFVRSQFTVESMAAKTEQMYKDVVARATGSTK